MITDGETDCVYLSDLLLQRHPWLADDLVRPLTGVGVEVRTIEGTKDIWCRDYMPIQVEMNRFVQFYYQPDYLRGRFRHLITNYKVSMSVVPEGQCVKSGLWLDGGNLVRWKNKVILTDKVFKENHRWSHKQVRRNLEEFLGVDCLIFIPAEPQEWLGHADGVVRFVADDTVIVNDYSYTDPGYRQCLLDELDRVGLKVIELPYMPSQRLTRGVGSAIGVYVNFLQVRGAIFVPTYRKPEDDFVCRRLEEVFPSDRIIPIESTWLAAEGGVLNCVTWGIKTQ
jgi:agmatine deiminase